MALSSPVPILRIFDEARARDFYLDFLGFSLDWEHRFEDNTPIYMQVSKDHCVLHLSEHNGDACPGSSMRIDMPNVDEYQQALIAKQYRYARPGVQQQPWGTRDMTITDPFGNKLIFCTDTD